MKSLNDTKREYCDLYHAIRDKWQQNPTALMMQPRLNPWLKQFIVDNSQEIARLGELHRELEREGVTL